MAKSVLRAVLARMQFTLHATRRTPLSASRLVQAMSAWLVKTRRAPFWHSRDARVYGHTTAAMHKLSRLHSSPPVSPPAKQAEVTISNQLLRNIIYGRNIMNTKMLEVTPLRV